MYKQISVSWLISITLKPYNKYTPSTHLTDILTEVHKELVRIMVSSLGYPIVFHPKEKKPGKKNTLVMFCDNCGYEVKVSRKVWGEKWSGHMYMCLWYQDGNGFNR